MNKKEKIKLIEEVVSHFKKCDELFSDINKTFGCCAESPIWDTYWTMFDSYTESVSKRIDDPYHFLQWFIWENDCGKKGYEIINEEGDKHNICSIEDFVEYAL